MNLSATRPSINKALSGIRIRSGSVYGIIIIMAMIAFETFNYSTTAYALKDLLGDLKFASITWSTLLALAFCGIDFAGIARLISPENRKGDLKESWYLFGAWLIAATANAALTWWGVAVAINGHALQSASLINVKTLTQVIPIFVAIMVWVIRILIIGSLSSALARINESKSTMSTDPFRSESFSSYSQSSSKPTNQASRPVTMTRNPRPVQPIRPEPTYHKMAGSLGISPNEHQQDHSHYL